MKNLPFLLSIVMLVLALPSAPGYTVEIPEAVASKGAGARMHEYLSRLESLGYHGSVLVAQKGKIILHQAYGIADVETGRANQTSTAFSTGSVTKQFTATAIMHLADRGKLSITDPITKFLKIVPDDKKEITVHHLLTHSSGLQGGFGRDSEELTREGFVGRMLASELAYPIGDHYEYSNAGFSMLAAIVEIVSGMDYEEYLQKELFVPLGMTRTGLLTLDVPKDQVARSHYQPMGYPSPADRPDDHWNLRGNGGILTTPADMYRWITGVYEGEVLTKDSREKMFTRHIKEYDDGNSYYGYGWVVQDTRRGGDVIWHNGGAMPHGWSCAVYRYVNDDAQFIVFANKVFEGQMPVDNIALNLSMILFGEDYVMPPQKTEALPTSNLTGSYALESGGTLRVDYYDGWLTLSPIGQEAIIALFPTGYASMLPKYNDKTEAMVEALASGDFTAAGNFFEKRGPGSNPAEMIREWWQEHDSLGAFERIEVLGTRMKEGAQTWCRLDFENGSEDYYFMWMNGQCQGIMGGVPFEKRYQMQSEYSFAAYSLAGGSLSEGRLSPEGQLILNTDEGELVATRVD